MALTSIIRLECPKCKKIAVEESRLTIGKSKIVKLTCGHLLASESFENITSTDVYSSIVFSDGCKPRDYQIEAVKFAERSGFRCIIADQQGLGKTIEVLCCLRLHPETLLPAVIACPTTIKKQIMHEIHRICGSGKEFLTQVIASGNEKAMPGFQVYIVTYDLLKKEDMFEHVPEINTLIIDECQRIKNHTTGRAKAVQAISKRVKYIIPMSGTPIENNAGEYFTVLNLVAPTRFPHYQGYLDRYCDTYDTFYSQKIGGVKDIDRFKADTSDIVIRRTKDEVLKDLPEFQRLFHHVELDAKSDKVYDKAMEELEDLMYDDSQSEFDKSGSMIAIMSRLRHICGLSKIDACVDFVTEFLLSSTDRKIVVFTHHNDVMDILTGKLNTWLNDGNFPEVEKLHAGLDGNGRAALVERFKNGPARVMVASTLASGEGLNLQFCSDAILLERQWNPSKEEQAEARFHRFGQLNKVAVTYMIASGRIDEYFTELVERKRAIVAGALDGKEIQWDQQSLMKELAEMLVSKGKKKWVL